MPDQNFMKYLQGARQGFNPYGAGAKVYGSGRSFPTMGKVTDQEGYEERDRQANVRRQQMRRNALLRRVQAGQQGRYMSPDWLRKGR